jgi:hypothetical protein
MSTDDIYNGVSPLSELPFIVVIEKVMLQVEYQYFAEVRSKRLDPLYKELCLIIAETLVADRNPVIKINGEYICSRLVRDVFSQIRNRHVQLVFDNFQNVSDRVVHKRAYLRTALYNSVFEFQARSDNKLIAFSNNDFSKCPASVDIKYAAMESDG